MGPLHGTGTENRSQLVLVESDQDDRPDPIAPLFGYGGWMKEQPAVGRAIVVHLASWQSSALHWHMETANICPLLLGGRTTGNGRYRKASTAVETSRDEDWLRRMTKAKR